MDAGTGQQDSLVSNLVDLIYERRTEALTETRLGELVCYSVTHIRRVFFAVMGESLGDFMLRVRLERAAGELSVGNQSIS